jgi:hypothetical protein
MKNKIVFATGMAVGYVLGTRAGRESYEQLKTKAQELWNDPKVQDTVSSTTDAIKEKAPAVQDSLKGALKKDDSGSDAGGTSSGKGKDEGANGTSSLDVPPVVSATVDSSSGNTGPSGGNPYEVEDTPFQDQDEDTRPNLDK